MGVKVKLEHHPASYNHDSYTLKGKAKFNFQHVNASFSWYSLSSPCAHCYWPTICITGLVFRVHTLPQADVSQISSAALAFCGALLKNQKTSLSLLMDLYLSQVRLKDYDLT